MFCQSRMLLIRALKRDLDILADKDWREILS